MRSEVLMPAIKQYRQQGGTMRTLAVMSVQMVVGPMRSHHACRYESARMEYLPYVLGAIFALILIGQMVPLWRARRARGRTVADLRGLLDERLLAGEPAVLYFWSPKCAMCAGVTPVLERLREEGRRVWLGEAAGVSRSAGG